MTRTFATLRQMSLHRQPAPTDRVCAIEDLHLSDQTSEACFAMLVESPGRSADPVPLHLPSGLSTALAGQSPTLRRSPCVTYCPRRVSPSCTRSCRLRSVQRNWCRPSSRKAEGNPFFLEELARVAAEHEDVQTIVTVPATVEGVIMARIDQLP